LGTVDLGLYTSPLLSQGRMRATATTAGVPAYFYNTSDSGRTRLRAGQTKEQKIVRSVASGEVLFNQ